MKEDSEFDIELYYKFQEEIEEIMKDFDIEKRRKAAIAEDDLRRFIITA